MDPLTLLTLVSSQGIRSDGNAMGLRGPFALTIDATADNGAVQTKRRKVS